MVARLTPKPKRDTHTIPLFFLPDRRGSFFALKRVVIHWKLFIVEPLPMRIFISILNFRKRRINMLEILMMESRKAYKIARIKVDILDKLIGIKKKRGGWE